MSEIDVVLKRDSASAKCRNCGRFARLPATDALGRCSLGDCIVQDLGVCSAWERVADVPIKVRRVGGGDVS